MMYGPGQGPGWVTVHDWNDKLIYDGPAPVPAELVTIDGDGHLFRFDFTPATPEVELTVVIATSDTRPGAAERIEQEVRRALALPFGAERVRVGHRRFVPVIEDHLPKRR